MSLVENIVKKVELDLLDIGEICLLVLYITCNLILTKI